MEFLQSIVIVGLICEGFDEDLNGVRGVECHCHDPFPLLSDVGFGCRLQIRLLKVAQEKEKM